MTFLPAAILDSKINIFTLKSRLALLQTSRYEIFDSSDDF